MQINLDGKTALVTGGNVGIGAAIARSLGACGARIAITYYSHDKEAEQTIQTLAQQGCQAEMYHLDATDSSKVPETMSLAAEGLEGKIDILVNNASHLVNRVSVDEMCDDHWHRVIDVNLSSAF